MNSDYEFARYSEDSDGSRGYVSDFQGSPESQQNYFVIDNKGILDYITLPRLEIVEQPGDYRYRYEKEKYHGHIYGKSNPPQTKKKDLYKFPSVRVHNYPGEVLVRCWLVSADADQELLPHVHMLCQNVQARSSKKENVEPLVMTASEKNSHEVVFDYMYIVHAVISRKEVLENYHYKRDWFYSRSFDKPPHTDINEKDLKNEIKKIDKNLSMLYFEAFDAVSKQRICQPVISRKIRNLHNVVTAPLKISEYSSATGSCKGGDRIFLFVEKVSKDVEVVFFTAITKSERTWEEKAEIIKVHHQYGIIIETPRYSEVDISSPTSVYFELFRRSDGVRSAPKKFTYLPVLPSLAPANHENSRKRPSSPLTSNSTESFVRFPKMAVSQVMPMIPTELDYLTNDNLSLVGDCEIDVLLRDILNSDLTCYVAESGTAADLMPLIPNLYGEVSTDSIAENGTKPLRPQTMLQAEVQGPAIRKIRPLNHLIRHLTSKFTNPQQATKLVVFINALIIAYPYDFIENTENFKLLLMAMEAKNVLNEEDREGNTIFFAASLVSSELVKVLLSVEEVDREATNYGGDTPLLYAARANSSRANASIEELLKNKFDPNVQNYKSGDTPLHIAVQNDDLELAKILIKYGGDPLKNNFYDESPYDISSESNEELKKFIYSAAQQEFEKKLSKRRPLSDDDEEEEVASMNGVGAQLEELEVK